MMTDAELKVIQFKTRVLLEHYNRAEGPTYHRETEKRLATRGELAKLNKEMARRDLDPLPGPY